MSLKSQGLKRYSLLMIVGGALGNLHDRFFFNAVPDFIDFHIGNFHWFIFNVSDIFITLGVISMIVLELFDNKNEKNITMIKNIKSLLLIIFSTILISSCGSVQKAFDPQNKNTSEEFLVEKKSPLSIPPSFEELPVPSNEKVNKESQINNIESLITEESNNEKLETVESDKDFEQSILDKIKNN
jgi:hypothetical protein